MCFEGNMSNKKLTVFGGGGFIGSAIMKAASDYGYSAVRGDWENISFNDDLGDVIYCLGVGDCNKPDDVINSHLRILQEIVNKAKFSRITYVSSTRVYMGAEHSKESQILNILPDDNRKLFNLAKLLAEAYLEASGVNYRIIRPSNVFGTAINSPLFLPSIVRDAVIKNKVDMYVTPDYSKDYVFVDDVAKLAIRITKSSKHSIYNIASGKNVSAKEIASILQEKSGCSIDWHKCSNTDKFPLTDISLIGDEFSFEPKLVEDLLGDMLTSFKKELLS